MQYSYSSRLRQSSSQPHIRGRNKLLRHRIGLLVFAKRKVCAFVKHRGSSAHHTRDTSVPKKRKDKTKKKLEQKAWQRGRQPYLTHPSYEVPGMTQVLRITQVYTWYTLHITQQRCRLTAIWQGRQGRQAVPYTCQTSTRYLVDVYRDTRCTIPVCIHTSTSIRRVKNFSVRAGPAVNQIFTRSAFLQPFWHVRTQFFAIVFPSMQRICRRWNFSNRS